MPKNPQTEIYALLELAKRDAATDILNSPDLDWNELLELAEKHRLVPTVFEQVKDFSQANQNAVDKLRLRNQEITKQNFGRSGLLIKIAGILENHGINQLSYKGMTLSKLAYGDATSRQFTDIDFLVRPKDARKAVQVLKQEGCRPAFEATAKQIEAVFRYDYEFPVFYRDTDTLAEIHWKFVEPFFAFDCDVEGAFRRSRRIELYGKDINTLSPEDHLVVICVHSSKHFWTRLSWVCDVDRLVSKTDLDWNLVMKLAQNSASEKMLLLGLALSNKLLGTELPKDLQRSIEKNESVQALLESMASRIIAGSAEPDNWKEMARIHIEMREKFITKLTYSRRLFWTKLVDKLFMPMGRPR